MSQTIAVQVLDRLIELFGRPGSWAQGNFAFDNKGNPTPPTHQQATSFCFVGGIHRAAIPPAGSEICATIISRVYRELDWWSKLRYITCGKLGTLTRLNDSRLFSREWALLLARRARARAAAA